MAGDSARRKYESVRGERRATLRSGRWVLLAMAVVAASVGAVVAHQILNAWWLGAMIGLLPVFKLLRPSQREVAWRKGAEGEEAVGRALDQLAPSARALHDRLIPGSRANIDHILVAPTGVWTVDAKNYSGNIETRRRGRELWVKGRNRSKLLAQAQRQRDVVSRALAGSGLGHVPVRPTLCFVGVDWPMFFRPSSAEGVALVSPRQLPSRAAGEAVLTAADVQRVADAIDLALRPAVAPDTQRVTVQPATPTTKPVPQPAKHAEAMDDPGVTTVNRWRRYGKDRLYVNDGDGETLGYVDLETNEVVPTEERHRLVVGEATAGYLGDA